MSNFRQWGVLSAQWFLEYQHSTLLASYAYYNYPFFAAVQDVGSLVLIINRYTALIKPTKYEKVTPKMPMIINN